MTTRGIRFLQSKKIRHEVVKYNHQIKGAEFAAQAVGFPLDRTIKTLVVALDDSHYALALMPGDRQLSMKKVAAACQAKRAAMADTATAQRLTGYLVGGISPFGTKHRLPVIMEEQVLRLEEILINAGQRGAMLKMDPRDVRTALSCRVAAVAEN